MSLIVPSNYQIEKTLKYHSKQSDLRTVLFAATWKYIRELLRYDSPLSISSIEQLYLGQSVQLLFADYSPTLKVNTPARVIKVKHHRCHSVAIIQWGHPDSRPFKITSLHQGLLMFTRNGKSLPYAYYSILRRPDSLIEWCCLKLKSMGKVPSNLPEELQERFDRL